MFRSTIFVLALLALSMMGCSPPDVSEAIITPADSPRNSAPGVLYEATANAGRSSELQHCLPEGLRVR